MCMSGLWEPAIGFASFHVLEKAVDLYTVLMRMTRKRSPNTTVTGEITMMTVKPTEKTSRSHQTAAFRTVAKTVKRLSAIDVIWHDTASFTVVAPHIVLHFGSDGRIMASIRSRSGAYLVVRILPEFITWAGDSTISFYADGIFYQVDLKVQARAAA